MGWLILDLKTTDDASPEAFGKKAFNLGYHIQAAYYTYLVQQCFGDENVDFLFCAIERNRPHCVGLYRAPELMIQKGRDLFDRALNTLSACKLSERFPGYVSTVSDLSIPAWVH